MAFYSSASEFIRDLVRRDCEREEARKRLWLRQERKACQKAQQSEFETLDIDGPIGEARSQRHSRCGTPSLENLPPTSSLSNKRFCFYPEPPKAVTLIPYFVDPQFRIEVTETPNLLEQYLDLIFSDVVSLFDLHRGLPSSLDCGA